MKSIKMKIFLTYMGLVLGIVLLSVLINAVFFRSYSISSDKEAFLSMEREIYEALADGSFSPELLSEKSLDYGVQLDVVDKTTREILYSSSAQQNYKGHGMRAMRPNYTNYDFSDEANYGFKRLSMMDAEMLIQIKSLSEGIALVIYKPLAMVERSVALANRFVLVVGLALLTLGGAVLYGLVSRQVRPILALHTQTEKMANLDFSERFTSHSVDEISKLGGNINAISDKLSATIDTLQSDIRKLTEVDGVRKKFIASVSHEFKTPLGIIKGYTEGLKYDLVEEQDKALYYDTIIDETDRMTLLVKDLIQMMQHELGQERLKLNPTQACAFFEDFLQKHRALHLNRTFDLQCTEAEVLMDERSITQVMDNFLANAYNYGAENSPIQIRLEARTDDVLISVHNQGPSIPEDQKDAIWESFHKVDLARTNGAQGTGLGLAINRTIIEAHGGSYGFKNTKDGVSFFFTLKKAS